MLSPACACCLLPCLVPVLCGANRGVIFGSRVTARMGALRKGRNGVPACVPGLAAALEVFPFAPYLNCTDVQLLALGRCMNTQARSAPSQSMQSPLFHLEGQKGGSMDISG